MKNTDLISLEDLCTYYNLDASFVDSIKEMNLVELIPVEKKYCIRLNELHEIERLFRLHCELNINLEGIDAISHLLEKVNELQHEVSRLRNRLSLYEDMA